MEQLRHNPRALSTTLFDRSKRFWGLALLCQAGVFGGGLSLIWVQDELWRALLTVVALVLSAASWALLRRRDAAKGSAEALLRKLDLKGSFGWELSRVETSDLLAELPRRVAKSLPPESLGEKYFASGRPKGPRRSMENLEESAWWSKHLSRYMSVYCFACAAVLLCVPVLILLVGAQAVVDVSTLSRLAQVVISVLTLVFALDVVGLALSYWDFRGQAERAEARARYLLSGGSADEVTAIKTIQEYHLARAAAPMIPTFVWKLHRAPLNELWGKYRAKYPEVGVPDKSNQSPDREKEPGD